MLHIRKQDLERIYQQGREEYPHECCGILTAGAGSDISQVHRCTNIQQEKHEEDPRQFSRDARIAYLIDPQQLYDIISTAEKEKGKVTGFYHSHIDCEAYFSEEDKRRAMTFGDEPDYPDAVYLVLSVYGEEAGRDAREVVGFQCFSWDEERADFAKVDLQVVE